jgi:putative oxidoreductase
MIRDFLFGSADGNRFNASFGLLLLRLFAGLSMAFSHGLGKLPVSPGFIETVAKLGFFWPEGFAWAAALSEFVGGLLIAAGLLTRPASLFLAITMYVAAFIRHGEDPFSSQEASMFYGVVALFFLFRGAGKYSVDAFINR